MKIGVVGLGYWGPKIVRNLVSIPGIEVYVCDKDPKKVERVTIDHGRKKELVSFHKFTEMVKLVDAVIIATNPLSTHYKLAKEALEAGKHVWLEKPMTKTEEQAKELVELARKKGLVLHVDHTFIYSGPVRKIKQIIKDGELGDITSVHMRWLNLGLYQPDMDVIWDLCPHAFSMLEYWFSSPPTCIYKVKIPYIDDSYLIFDYDLKEGRFRSNIHVSWNYPEKIRECVITGTQKMLKYDDMTEDKITMFDKRALFDPATKEVTYVDKGRKVIEYNKTEPLLDECNHFVRCIEKGEESISNGWSGLRVVQLLNRVSP